MLKTKMRYVLLALLALVMVIAPAATATRAQGADCLPGLDADTCALFTAATENQGSITSFVMDYNIAMKTTGTGQDIDLSVVGSGPMDLAALMAADPTTAMSDPSGLIKAITASQTMDASMTTAGNTIKGNFEFRIVEGVLYFNGDLATQGKWMKIDLLQALSAASGQMAGLQGQLGAATGAADPAMAAQVMSLFSDPSKFFTTEVGEGQEVDGVKTTSITLTVNIKALVEALFSEEGRAVLLEILKAQGQEMDAQQLEQAAAAIRIFEPVLDATKMSMSWWIDPEAKQFRGFGLTFNTVVDKTTAALLNPQAATPSEITVDFNFLVTLSKLNEAVTVEPVADAVDAMPAAN
jgi:hypothetical protein